MDKDKAFHQFSQLPKSVEMIRERPMSSLCLLEIDVPIKIIIEIMIYYCLNFDPKIILKVTLILKDTKDSF
jgi:hypothetical protein